MSHIGTTNLFWTGTALWVGLWAIFVIRLAWLDARLRAHLTEHHPHRWRRLSWSRRLTWSVWFVFLPVEGGLWRSGHRSKVTRDVYRVLRHAPGPGCDDRVVRRLGGNGAAGSVALRRCSGRIRGSSGLPSVCAGLG